jgi:hypothetical protein
MAYRIPKSMLNLSKGTQISFSSIAHLLPPCESDKQRNLHMLNWKLAFERQRRKCHKPVTTVLRQEGWTIDILDDAEASDYNARKFAEYGRRQVRTHRRQREVNEANLDTTQRNTHEARINRQSMILQAVRSAQARVMPASTAYVRKTPAMA